jgi:hypothetical protein
MWTRQNASWAPTNCLNAVNNAPGMFYLCLLY